MIASSRTTFTLAIGQSVIFKIGGSGTATVFVGSLPGQSYVVGQQEAFIGPFTASASVVVDVTNGSIEYVIDGDGSLDDQSPAIAAINEAVDAVNRSFTDSSSLADFSLWGGTVGVAAEPFVSGGKMTYAPPAAGAGYAEKDIGQQVRRLGAKFSFGAYSTNTGSCVLVAWQQKIKDSYPTIPESPCHLSISPTGWNYSVVVAGVVTTVAFGTFYTPLSTGVDYTAEVVIDQESDVAYFTLPDGTTRSVTNSQIGIPATIACFEIYRQAATDTIGAFTSVLASAHGASRIADLKRAISKQDHSTVLVYAPAVAEAYDVPTSVADIAAGLTVPFVVPPSGKCLVELTGNIAHTLASNVLWVVRDAATGATTPSMTVSETVKTGNVTATGVISGMTPGRTMNFAWRHFTTVATSCSFRASLPNGRLAVMKITPLP